MKKSIFLLSLISISSLASEGELDKESQYSIGLGVGSSYSGLGANLALLSENDMKYISYGCVSHGSVSGTTCGAGIGWIKTDLIDFGNNNHGFGVYISIVDNERGLIKNDAGQWVSDSNDVYGAGVSYNYFMNGIDESGFVFGASLHATNADYDDNHGGFLQVGYQF